MRLSDPRPALPDFVNGRLWLFNAGLYRQPAGHSCNQRFSGTATATTRKPVSRSKGEDPVSHPSQVYPFGGELNPNQISGAIIISASGMWKPDGSGIILNTIWRPKRTVLFIGYQAEGTWAVNPDGQKTVRIFGDEITVKADIRNIECYSSIPTGGLLRWIKSLPREVFLVHGSLTPQHPTDLIRLNRLKVTIPAWRQIVKQPRLLLSPMLPQTGLPFSSGKIGNSFPPGSILCTGRKYSTAWLNWKLSLRKRRLKSPEFEERASKCNSL